MSKPMPVVKSPTSATNIHVQKLKHDMLVKILGQTANTLGFTANILPSTRVDPRYNNGLELVRLADGSVYSGVYLVTEVKTVYSNGQRSRTISGLGHKIDKMTPTVIVTPKKGDASSNVSKTSKTSNPSGSSKSNKSGKSKDSKSGGSSSGGKSTAPKKDMYYDPKTGKWIPVGN